MNTTPLPIGAACVHFKRHPSWIWDSSAKVMNFRFAILACALLAPLAGCGGITDIYNYEVPRSLPQEIGTIFSAAPNLQCRINGSNLCSGCSEPIFWVSFNAEAAGAPMPRHVHVSLEWPKDGKRVVVPATAFFCDIQWSNAGGRPCVFHCKLDGDGDIDPTRLDRGDGSAIIFGFRAWPEATLALPRNCDDIVLHVGFTLDHGDRQEEVSKEVPLSKSHFTRVQWMPEC